MTSKVKPIPEGYHTVTPYLIVNNAADAIEFYKKAFGAIELLRMPGPNGKIMHAEIKIGDSPVMLADECPEKNVYSPKNQGPSSISICLYIEDVDALTHQAIAAGAKVIRPLADQFYGDRSSMLSDPFGHTWTLLTHKEDLSFEEINKRFEALMKCESNA